MLVDGNLTYTRLKSVLKEPLVYGLNESATEDNPDWPRYIRITDFDDNNNLSNETFKSLPIEVAQNALLKDGDILFARSGATVGKTFLYRDLPNGACYAGYLIRARLNKKVILPEYLSFLTKSTGYLNWKNKICTQATIQNISAEKYNQLPLHIPSITEQKQIIQLLEHDCSAIDAKISICQDVIEKYSSLKRSIIRQTFSNTQSTPGERAHSEWTVRRIKEIAILKSGTTPKASEDKYYENGKHPWLNTSDVQNGVINQAKFFVTDQALVDYPILKYLPKGTVLMAMYGGGTIGNVALMDIEATTNQACCAMIPKRGLISPKFLFYHLIYSQDGISCQGSGGSQVNLSQAIIARQLISFPSLTKQEEIIFYLDKQCEAINTAINNIERQIEKYKNLKVALIDKLINTPEQCD